MKPSGLDDYKRFVRWAYGDHTPSLTSDKLKLWNKRHSDLHLFETEFFLEEDCMKTIRYFYELEMEKENLI